MGGLVRLGSVHRDAGRLDRAIAMLEAAKEIGESLRGSDPALVPFTYDANYQLAELYLDKDEPERAERYVHAAVELAQKILHKEPDNPEWMRFLGFSYRLQGRAAMARKQWEAALAAFDLAVPIREKLLSLDPDNRSLKSELASVRALRSKALRRLQRYDEAVSDVAASYDIYQELAQAEPEATAYQLELARTETRLGVLHLCRRTMQDDDSAAEWFGKAGDRLTRVQASAQAESHAWPIHQILDSVRKNQELIRQRVARRSETPD
jgi:tetratricopeptide (TPR) repeat protein